MRRAFIILISFWGFSNFSSASSEEDVVGIFNSSIYDQRSLYTLNQGIMQFNPGTNADSIEMRAVEVLREKKREVFINECIRPLDEIVENLRGIIEEHRERAATMAREAASTARKDEYKSGARGFFTSLVSKVADDIPIIRGISRTVVETVTQTVCDAETKAAAAAREFLEKPSPETRRRIEEKIRECEDKKGPFIKALSRDAFAGFDEFYVRRKWTFPLSLQERIEEVLIQAKRSPYQAAQYRQFLKYALTIPMGHKSVDEIDLTRRFLANPIFRNYADPLKADLLRIAFDVSKSSQVQNEELSFPLRQICYFYGAPGNGKSTAAENLAKFLELPYFKVNIRTAQDLSKSSLEGSEGSEGTPGWFAEALLEGLSIPAGAAEGVQEILPGEDPIMQAIRRSVERADLRGVDNTQTYSNGFLIINDFDRILLDPYASTTALAFFLEYLDTDKKSFLNPYFKKSLQINRLNILITGNHPIPEESKFEALRDRLTEVPFPAIGVGAFEDVIARSIRDAPSYGPPMTIEEQERLRQMILAQRGHGLSFRGIKRAVKHHVLTSSLPVALKNLGHLRPEEYVGKKETPLVPQSPISTTYSETEVLQAVIGGGAVGVVIGIVATKSIQYILKRLWQ